MAVKRIIVHSVEIEDQPGSLQKLFASAASANVDFSCAAAFSTGTGRGRVYINAKDPDAFRGCAQELGLEAAVMTGFLLSGEDRIGAGADALKGLAQAGINAVASAVMAFEEHYQMLIVLNAADGDEAQKVLGA